MITSNPRVFAGALAALAPTALVFLLTRNALATAATLLAATYVWARWATKRSGLNDRESVESHGRMEVALPPAPPLEPELGRARRTIWLAEPPSDFPSTPLAVWLPPLKGWTAIALAVAGTVLAAVFLRRDLAEREPALFLLGVLGAFWALLMVRALVLTWRQFSAVGDGWLLQRSLRGSRTVRLDDVSVAWLGLTVKDAPDGLRLDTPVGIVALSEAELNGPVGTIALAQLLRRGTPMGRRLITRAVRATHRTDLSPLCETSPMSDLEILWTPDPQHTSRLDEFVARASGRGAPTGSYADLWRWSTTDLDAFWLSVWEFFDIPSDTAPTVALAEEKMPGAVWFPEVRTNYAETMLRLPGRADDDVVVVARSQSRGEVTLTAAELRDLVGRVRAGLVRAGVGEGDRVAAYLPNIPEALALLLATASLGAIFTSCAPEFGTQSVTDRWRQIEPKVLVAVDGYRYGDKPIDRRAEVHAIRTALPSLTTVVQLPYLDADATTDATSWAELTAEPGPMEFVRVPFAHPLYILFSSGTTGLPKPIVHGHGGITVEHLKALALQSDLGPGDRFFWFSTTGWMMWNYLVSGLGVGSTVVMFDGNPGHPDVGMLWRMAAEVGVTYFGTSAPFLLQCRKEGVVPREIADLSALRGIGSTGAPLPAEGFRWVYDAVSATAQLGSISGGTDICSAFVGSAPNVPVVAGEIACRCLGSAVAAYDENAHPVIGRLGELVIERPMPSMPVGFWGDEDGSRYRSAYFEDIPGVWRHGDWITITEHGTCTITGRSDATLNRGGVRLGTAEFYTVVEALPEVLDSLVVHLEDAEGGAGTLVLFVRLAEGLSLTDEVRRLINSTLRSQLSPRHVPDIVHQVSAIPHTLSGKRIEVPVKKILQGRPTDEAVARGALTDADALCEFEDFRETLF